MSSSTVKTEAANFFKTWVPVHQIALYHFSGDCVLLILSSMSILDLR